MDSSIAALLAITALIAIVAALGFVFVKTVKDDAQNGAKKQAATDVDRSEAESTSRGTARRGATDRMRAGRLRQRAAAQQAAASQQAAAHASDSENDSVNEDTEEEEEAAGPRNKKERGRQARQEAREAERAAREARDSKRSAYDERRRKKEEEREARERAQEEEIRRAEEERLEKEEEEAAKWLGMISMEKEGTGEAEVAQESQGLLGAFIEYIRERKTVPLEALATEFKLRTTDVIDRIHGLEAMGRITGLMDERGKYIYISTEEMMAVANYIKSKGRVGISELAAKSNTFIDLEAKAAAVVGGPTAALDFDAVFGQEGETVGA